MDLNRVLIWFVVASSVVNIVQVIRLSSSTYRGWLIVALAVLGVTGVAFLAAPATAGYVGAMVWAVFVAVPSLGSRLVVRWTVQQDYARARRLAATLAWLHPTESWRREPALLAALEAAQWGDLETASALLGQYRSPDTSFGRIATVHFYRLNGQWEELRAWIEEQVGEEILRQDPNMLAVYLRCLGELGEPDRMLDTFLQYERRLLRQGVAAHLHSCRLFILAFCGRPNAVQRLLLTKLGSYPDAVKQFWLATARLAQQDNSPALDGLNQQLTEADVFTRLGIQRRLERPLACASDVLRPEHAAVLDRFELEIEQEERYGERFVVNPGTAYATFALIALNLGVFCLEIVWGGSTNQDTLVALGALHTEALQTRSEWWRLLSATFLHYGWLHLIMNMLGLFVFGPFVEYALGRWRFLVAYLACGVGSMTLVCVASQAGWIGEGMVVGASGAILGLAGATGGILWRAWRRERARVAWRRLILIGAVIVLQTVVDVVTPEVSSTAHLSGALIGLICGALLRCRL